MSHPELKSRCWQDEFLLKASAALSIFHRLSTYLGLWSLPSSSKPAVYYLPSGALYHLSGNLAVRLTLFCRVGRFGPVSRHGLKRYTRPRLFSLLQPPNDPHGIQREDLILSLRAVLASTPRFAEVGLARVRACSLRPQKGLKKEQLKAWRKRKIQYTF